MKQCLALRHVHFEDLGLFAEPLRRHGYDIHYVGTPVEELRLDETMDADLLVVLGGPVGANDLDAYPWITLARLRGFAPGTADFDVFGGA